MDKIATPQDLTTELQSIMAFIHASEKPDRQVIASKIRELADRVTSEPDKTAGSRATLEVAEELMWALTQEVKQSLDSLQILRTHIFQGKRGPESNYPQWEDLNDALKKAEGPLTGAVRALKSYS